MVLIMHPYNTLRRELVHQRGEGEERRGRRDWDWIEIGLDFFLGIDWLGLGIGLISFLKFLDFSWEVIGLFGGILLTSQRNFLGLL